VSKSKRGQKVTNMELSKEANRILNTGFVKGLPGTSKYLSNLAGVPVEIDRTARGVKVVLYITDSRRGGLRVSETITDTTQLNAQVIKDNEVADG